MRVFRAKRDIDHRGQEWSPRIATYCPYCRSRLEFYSNLPHNECKFCFKPMPFPSAMARRQEERIEYHVHGETEDISEQSDVGFLRLREGD